MAGRFISFGHYRPERAGIAVAGRSKTLSTVPGNARSLTYSLGLLALLMALAMRLLVPTGFMWDTAANGGAWLIPCSGMAPVPSVPAAHSMHHMAMSGASHEKGKHDGDSSNRECAFSAFGSAIDLTDPFVAPAAPLLAVTALLVPPALTIAPGHGLAAPPPPPRGPPLTL